ncbi:hypothetical protein T08_12456 [Trichinella sp. T8]|nr:hypothetical protein T08_12456 [Trichinella sp. T8]
MYDSTFALYVIPDRSADSLFEWKLARCSSVWDWDTSKGRSYPIVFDFVKPLTHEKHCIQISKHVINHGKIMHMEKKEDKWRKPVV